MSALGKLFTNDGNIMKLRALGYSQSYIAKKLGISQPAISQRLKTIKKRTITGKNDDTVFWELLLGIGAAQLLERLFEKSFLEDLE